MIWIISSQYKWKLDETSYIEFKGKLNDGIDTILMILKRFEITKREVRYSSEKSLTAKDLDYVWYLMMQKGDCLL